jgi:hypothetical protein
MALSKDEEQRRLKELKELEAKSHKTLLKVKKQLRRLGNKKGQNNLSAEQLGRIIHGFRELIQLLSAHIGELVSTTKEDDSTEITKTRASRLGLLRANIELIEESIKNLKQSPLVL